VAQVIKSLVFKAAETGEEAVRRSIALIKALLAKDVLDHLQARPRPARIQPRTPTVALCDI
jgi:hypothetical protein